MTEAIFIAVFVVFVVGSLIFVFLSDNRRNDQTKFDLSWLANDRVVRNVQRPVAWDVSRQRAELAIRNVGGIDVESRDNCSIGWIGRAKTNIPSLAQYELVVCRFRESETSTRFVCASRVRYEYTPRVDRREQELANQLAMAISSGPA